MKTIGLLGGMSWESSAEYYRLINVMVRERLGGLHSAQCTLFSFDFASIEALQSRGDWDAATLRMIAGARQVERGGADCLVICTNTMHRMADEVQNAIDIPLIHIATATAQAAQQASLNQLGLLGTRFTMQERFYRDRLAQHAIVSLIPDEEGCRIVDRIIYDELVVGVIRDDSRQAYLKVIDELGQQGAQGIILGCTEIGLLIKAGDTDLPLFDTTFLHAQAAVNWALS